MHILGVLLIIALGASRTIGRTCTIKPLGYSQSDVSQIEAAIAACGHGGTTVLEAGEYNITRKMHWDLANSHVDLHGSLNFVFDLEHWMDPGSTYRVIFIQSQASWFVVSGHDFTIDAHGTGGIVGNGQHWWSWYGNATRLDGDGRPVSLTLSHVARGTVRDFRVDGPPFWCNAVADSSDVLYDGMTCVSENADETWFGQNIVWNTDGIDTYRSDNITMLNWDITTGDDCLAIKGNSTNVFAKNVTCRGGTGIAFGSVGQYSQLPDYVDNVVLEDITFVRPDTQVQPLMEHGVYFKSWTGTRIGFPPTGGGAGGGRVSGVVARNVNLDQVTTPIQVYQTNLGHPGDKPSKLQFTNLTFTNWTGTAQTSTVVDLECSPAAPCTDLTFEQINIAVPGDQVAEFACVNVASVAGVACGGWVPFPHRLSFF
ncbi:pectin lyase-like protein [Dichomitus squalens]|uniref:galacturonan 1,4-alpha-galacturonidase n=1 Tax=Dichomitus squalens TaxID=114155 RepID=A0A4Q9MIB7_9APHY|nr:pectin lyase-like protein [Dichomitus squalens]